MCNSSVPCRQLGRCLPSIVLIKNIPLTNSEQVGLTFLVQFIARGRDRGKLEKTASQRSLNWRESDVTLQKIDTGQSELTPSSQALALCTISKFLLCVIIEHLN